MTTVTILIGRFLKETRQKRHKGLREVARAIQCSYGHLSDIENGKRGLSIDKIARMARFLLLTEKEKTTLINIIFS